MVIVVHSFISLDGWAQKRTQREKNPRSLFYLVVTEHEKDGERTRHSFFSLFPFSSHVDCSGVPFKVIRDKLLVPLSA